MKITSSILSRIAATTVQLSLIAGAMFFVTAASAKQPVPANLGNGLDRLVASNVALKSAPKLNVRGAQAAPTFAAADGRLYNTEENAGLATLAISDAKTGKFLVRINLNGSVKPDQAITSLPATVQSLEIGAVDKNYHGVGVMNAYVSIDDVPALAASPGVASVILELKPRFSKAATDLGKVGPIVNANPGQVVPNLGTYFDQGVIQHRVDTISQYYTATAPFDYEGQGLSIACISNSFAANTANPASVDVTNNDLPGNSSGYNPQPVVVLQDDLSSATSDDEGRGMCQIVYHMAPKARVGFATADNGEVGFANNIRALAGMVGFTYPNQTFAADVICDDVGYFDEPFYEDGIIGAGVNDVAAAGVSYFSSAANDIGINGYESVIRVVPNGTGLTAPGNTALANTNINLTGVPTNLYAGGFHNFNPNPGQIDVAQLVNVAANNTVPTVLQWNDPYDQNAGFISLGAQIFASSATFVSTPIVFNGSSSPALPLFNAGQGYQVVVTATSGNFDAIVTIINPDGSTLLTQDTGTDETVTFVAPTSGQYQISVNHYQATTGNFNITVNLANITPYVGSDWNLLAFRTDTGAYVPASSLTTNNIASNEPVELGYVNRTSASVLSIQYVLARSNTPSGPHVADHIRYAIPGNGRAGYGPAEYFTYNTVTTAGHATANGCNGTAAYAAFRPSIPEYFTSPGPATIYFDKNQNLLATPEIRLQPGVAAMDAGNISANEGLAGLGSDSTSDYDAAANFSGTSAAAPHAAACALLVLQAHGGFRTVTPAQMTKILHNTAFVHDLDPNYSSSSARATNGGKVTLTFSSDNESNAGTGLNDANSMSIAYTGPSYITSLVFNPAGTAANGGNVTGGNNGLDVTNAYFTNVFPGMVWNTTTKAFTVGNGSVGLTSADVNATFSNPAPAPSTTQSWTMTLAFGNSNFTGGKILNFTVGRQIQHSSVLPSGTTASNFSADLFGGGVQLPEGTVTNDGMTYSGTLGDGSTFSGIIRNRIGAGYSILDGFGFINAQAAVSAPLQ